MSSIMLLATPPDWKISRLGQFFLERNEKVNDEDFEPLSVTMNGIVPQMDHVAKSEDRDNRKRVTKGDFVINSRSDRRGASGMSDYEGSASLISLVLKPRGSVFPRFFHYLLRSIAFQEEFYRFGHGIVADLWTTRFSEFKNIPVALPDHETQVSIVRFLDEQCMHIEGLIARKEQLIALLKDRENDAVGGRWISSSDSIKRLPSPFLWLPEMPSHWAVRRAKYMFVNVNDAPREADSIITAYRDGQVTLRDNRRSEGYTFAVKEVGYQHIQRGDLVIHTMDAFAGAIGVSESDGKATGEYAVCRPRSGDVNNHYYAQALRCMAARNYIYVLCPSVRERAPRFRFAKFAPVYLPVPPRKEQDAVAEMVNESRLLRAKAESSISLLKQYRASLVTEVVTGQSSLSESDHVLNNRTKGVA